MGANDPVTRERSDPLLAAALLRRGVPERVNYATGVLLDSVDFEDEQSYQRGRLARALSALFGFGTLCGLRVRCRPDHNPKLEVEVLPGLALDRLGRCIEVRRKQCCSVADWLAQRAALPGADPERQGVIDAVRGTPAVLTLDVCVRFVVCEHGKTPAFAAGPFNATDYLVPARLADAFELRLALAATGPGGVLREPANALPALDQKIGDLAAVADPAERARQRRAWAIDSVLDAWVEPDPEHPERLAKLAEQASVDDWNQVLLARVALPVTQPAAGAFPLLDAARMTAPGLDLADNSLRPIVFVPTAWRGVA